MRLQSFFPLGISARILFVAAICGLTLSMALATPSWGPPLPEPELVPDRSLPIEAYVALGVPPLDQKWDVKDYADACEVLVKLAEDDIAKLPRFGS